MRMKRMIWVLACGLSMGLQAQTLQHCDSGLTWAETITAEDLSEHLYVLAADSMEGRETGKEGQRKAAAYVADHFEASGLEPVQGLFQEVPLKVTQLKGGILTWGESKLLFKNDWVPYPGIEASDVEGDIVFVGYGIQDEGWDDYAGLDVQGRMVVMLSGEPGNADKGYDLTGTRRRVAGVQTAMQSGNWQTAWAHLRSWW